MVLFLLLFAVVTVIAPFVFFHIIEKFRTVYVLNEPNDGQCCCCFLNKKEVLGQELANMSNLPALLLKLAASKGAYNT